MKLFENPFFILGAMPFDNRHRIFALAEEKDLLLDSEKCSVARNALTTPQRRLVAEINWFLGCSNETREEIIDYISALQSGSQVEEINKSEMSTLAELNLKRYAFPFLPLGNVIQYKYVILEISRLFAIVESEQIRLEVNEVRSVSGFPLVTDKTEIDNELRNIRSDIRHIISQKITELSEDNIAEVVTMLTEKYISDERYSGSAVIDDVISEYALQFDVVLQNQKLQINKLVEYIGKSVDDIPVGDAINDLIKLVNRWDKFAQPLQLDARAKGISHADSEELAGTIRELAVDLHNKHGQTGASLKLVTVLKDVFAELPDFAQRMAEDADTLLRLKAEQEEEEWNVKESYRRNQLDKLYAVTLSAARFSVPPFCTCCMKPTNMTEKISTTVSHQSLITVTTREISINMPLCEDCLAHREEANNRTRAITIFIAVIVMVNVFLISLANNSQSKAFWIFLLIINTIAFFLFRLIPKSPSLSDCHSTIWKSVWLSEIGIRENTTTFTFTNWRYAKLFSDANDVSMLESDR